MTPATDPLRLWLRLLSCTNLIERRVRDALRTEFESTLPRFDLLAQLEHAREKGEPHLPMGELSRRLMVSNGNVTGLAARLEREGLVERVASPSDRRRQLVRLTTEGRRALRRMAVPHQQWIGELFATMAADDRLELHRLLGQLKDSAESAATARATPARASRSHRARP